MDDLIAQVKNSGIPVTTQDIVIQWIKMFFADGVTADMLSVTFEEGQALVILVGAKVTVALNFYETLPA